MKLQEENNNTHLCIVNTHVGIVGSSQKIDCFRFLGHFHNLHKVHKVHKGHKGHKGQRTQLQQRQAIAPESKPSG